MTTVKFRGRKKKGYVVVGNEVQQPNHTVRQARKPDPPPMSGLGSRIKEVKRIGEREVDPEARVARLTKVAHEFGPEYLDREIDTHKRKIADLESAKAKYYDEIKR